ncbi:hypothetical protein IP91_04600 [Pseudoduganella lurida]|uniref:Uncharacterized protein n=1 Tax=Pseudoduganella lurida TaxID=1036180 RepID=A0A562QZ92_9BURK|nr:hypothetical protein [Pseudoduganella lurida]TWI61520.1 hypothetical protein IP91_04600 [Pseudoduganella lurida]
MTKYRNRAVLYFAEAALAVGLALLPVRHDLPALTAIGLFLHLTTSLGMLPFQWRASGSDMSQMFGIPHRLVFLFVMTAGLALMAAWVLHGSTPLYLAGVFFAAAALEVLVT